LTGISCERSSSSAACTESASRSGISDSASRSIPGIHPTVDTAVRRCDTPTSGRRAHASSTASTFISGSPMPMKITFEISSERRKCSAWSRISDAVRLRPKRIWPVAQKVHVSGQPDCEETQTELRPSR